MPHSNAPELLERDPHAHWSGLGETQLLESAWDFAEQLGDPAAAACIQTLVWRLKGALEWIESRKSS